MPMTRSLLAAAGLLALQACWQDDLAGGPPPTDTPGTATVPATEFKGQAFPSGTWYDGYGGSWQVAVADDFLTAKWTGTPDDLMMAGKTGQGHLFYEIYGPDQLLYAIGLAVLTDEAHANFVTFGADGSPNLSGQLHFNHLPGQSDAVGTDTFPVAPCEADPCPQDIKIEQPEKEAADEQQQ